MHGWHRLTLPTNAWTPIALLLALLALPACSTDITVNSSIHLSAGSTAMMRFQPIPPSGTIDMRNTGPDRAILEFYGPDQDSPGYAYRLLTVDLPAGASRLESVAGVQRIEVSMRGDDETTLVYSIRSREGVGLTINAGPGAVITAGEKAEPPPDAPEPPIEPEP